MKVDKDSAEKIAANDARSYYRDLTAYNVTAQLVDGNWKIDYELKDRQAQGGGPHYVVSAESGEIVSKRFEQ